MTRTTPLVLSLALVTVLGLAAPAVADYVSGGTFVVKAAGTTVVDNGGVVCQGLTGSGVGGGCLPLPPATSDRGVFVRVNDQVAAANVAFQVCIDNNGDGICGGVQTDRQCRDQIYFSHADGGKFFNALGPLPSVSLKGCPNAFQGYVVLLCEGEHVDSTGPHTHAVTRGQIGFALDGSGFGTFCGGNGGGTPDGFSDSVVAKAYKVV